MMKKIETNRLRRIIRGGDGPTELLRRFGTCCRSTPNPHRRGRQRYAPPSSLRGVSSISFLRYVFSRRVASRSNAWYLMQTRR